MSNRNPELIGCFRSIHYSQPTTTHAVTQLCPDYTQTRLSLSTGLIFVVKSLALKCRLPDLHLSTSQISLSLFLHPVFIHRRSVSFSGKENSDTPFHFLLPAWSCLSLLSLSSGFPLMASSLEDELSCPVCLEIYQDPQLLSCGHSFCRRCVGYHPTVFSALYTRTCPVCLQAIHLEPVTNLVLRSACESYQKEKEKKEREEKEREEREKDGGIKCLLHGEKILFFCRNDKEALCSQCRKERHSSHRVQPLPHAVHQQKVCR